jgi:hypothetical protein
VELYHNQCQHPVVVLLPSNRVNCASTSPLRCTDTMFTLGIVNREWFLLSTRPLPRVSMLSRPLPKPALPTVALAHRVPRLVVVLRQAAHPVPLPLAALLGTAAAPQLSSPLWVLQPVYCCSVMCRFMCRWDKLDIAGYHINLCGFFIYFEFNFRQCMSHYWANECNTIDWPVATHQFEFWKCCELCRSDVSAKGTSRPSTVLPLC